MSEEIEIYKKNLGKCAKCNRSLNKAMSFHNIPKNCEDGPTFSYMQIGESMHAECYIEHVIDTYIKKVMRDDR